MSKLVVGVLLFAHAFSAEAALASTTATLKQSGWLHLTDCLDTVAQMMVVPINTCIHDTTSTTGGKAVRYTDVLVLTGATAVPADVPNAAAVQYKIEQYYHSDCSDATPLSVSGYIYAQSVDPTSDGATDTCVTVDIDTGREMADRTLYLATATQSYAAAAYPTGGAFVASTYDGTGASYPLHYGEVLATSTLAIAEFTALKDQGYFTQYYSDSGCSSSNFKGGAFYRRATTADLAMADADVCHTTLTPNQLAANFGKSFAVKDLGAVSKYSSNGCAFGNLISGSTYDAQQPINMATISYVPDTVDTDLGLTPCAAAPSSQWVSGLPSFGNYFQISGFIQTDTSAPTSMPTFTAESYGQTTWDIKKRHRVGGLCENGCSGHGSCVVNQNCLCYTGMDGEPEWTGPDCSLRTCPHDFAWVGDVVNANDLHPWAECSNRGTCDRKTGVCACFPGYDGVACQRFSCPNNCNDRGTCWPEKHLAVKASRVYDAPWDAMKAIGCLCDAGFRGPSCEFQECPSGSDPLDGYGNEAGRDCSGRGLCDYGSGTCNCFSGFFGTRCQYQTTLM
jgi:hypothetical protein